MKKIIDVLRKLGVFRSGTFGGTYRSGKDMPSEMLMDDVFDSKKDLVNKKDIKDVKETLNSQSKIDTNKPAKTRKFFFWIVVFLGALFLLANISIGLSWGFFATLFLWAVMLFVVWRFAFFGFYSFGAVILILILVLFLSLMFFPSSGSNDGDGASRNLSGETGKIDFEKKVLNVSSENGDVLGTIGLEKKTNKKSRKETISATYNLLLKADLPFNSKCGGEETKTPRCNERYEYSGRLVRSDRENDKKGNGATSAVYCNKDKLGDPFSTFGEMHTLEVCGVNNTNGVIGLKTDTFLSSFMVVFESYQDVLDSNQFEMYSFADFWEKLDGEVRSYRGNTDLPVEKTNPVKKFDLVVTQ